MYRARTQLQSLSMQLFCERWYRFVDIDCGHILNNLFAADARLRICVCCGKQVCVRLTCCASQACNFRCRALCFRGKGNCALLAACRAACCGYHIVFKRGLATVLTTEQSIISTTAASMAGGVRHTGCSRDHMTKRAVRHCACTSLAMIGNLAHAWNSTRLL